VSSHYFQLLRHIDVILERIFIAIGAKNITRVANSRFADRVRILTNRIHGDLEIRQIIKRVEDAENIHPALGGVFNEAANHIVGIVGIAHTVGTAKEHLKAYIGDALT